MSWHSRPPSRSYCEAAPTAPWCQERVRTALYHVWILRDVLRLRGRVRFYGDALGRERTSRRRVCVGSPPPGISQRLVRARPPHSVRTARGRAAVTRVDKVQTNSTYLVRTSHCFLGLFIYHIGLAGADLSPVSKCTSARGRCQCVTHICACEPEVCSAGVQYIFCGPSPGGHGQLYKSL